MAEGRYGEAAGLVDDVLRSSRCGDSKADGERFSFRQCTRLAHQNLIEQVATYRASIEDLLGRPKARGAAGLSWIRIDTHSGQARGEEGAALGRGESYPGRRFKLAVGEYLSHLQAGAGSGHVLEFRQPGGEYAL